MHKLLLFFLAAFCFIGTRTYSQCTVSIDPGSALVCTSDSLVLNATVTGTFSQMDAATFAGNNHRGNMFDIVAANAVVIQSFDVFPMGNTTVEVYYKTGTWNGFANSPADWTLIGSAPVVAGPGLVPLALPINVTIPAGQTYAFYVTSNTSSVSLNYSNGTTVGNVFSSDANISFLEGGGMEYPFTVGTGSVYQPRVWNGSIHYSLANAPGTSVLWNTTETTFSIQPAITTTTQYTVEAEVPGCSTMYDTVLITTSVPPVFAGNDTAVCAGAMVTLSGSGAVTYAWTGGITDTTAFDPLATADYVVTGTDSIGCAVNDTVTITVLTNPLTNAGVNGGSCPGDSLTLQAQGADTYVWSNSLANGTAFVPVSTDTYVVIGTAANGCSVSDTLSWIVYVGSDANAGIDRYVCGGTEITLNGSGAGSYDWNNGVTNGVPFTPIAGAYSVIGYSVDGCPSYDTLSIFVNNLNAPITVTGATLSTNILADGTTQWINCSDMSSVAGETSPTFTPSTTGSYAVILTDWMGCTDTSDCALIDFTGIEENTLSGKLAAYPVPTNGKVTLVSSGAAILRVELIDLTGHVLLVAEPNTTQTELDLSNYAPGHFFARVYRGNGIELLKVVKE